MSGIEQAFKDFVKRVSEKENQEQVSEERGYQYGGGAIGYNHGGRINYSSGSGYPPIEEDNQSVEFGQKIQTPQTGFNFQMNPPTPPVIQQGQEPITGNFRDFRNMMSNVNPQLSYIDNNFGGNISANMNPFTNAPKSYSANAYYGSEQDRLNFGINTIPTAGAKQIMIGREGPYGNISLGASRDPSGNNYSLNYSNSFADGGRIVDKKEPLYNIDPLGYTRNTNEESIVQINPMEKDLETIGGIAGVEGIGQLMAKKGLEEAASSASATARDIRKYLNDKMKTAKGSKDVLNDISMKEILEDSIGGAPTHSQMKDFIKNYYKDYFKDASLNKKFASGGYVNTDLTRTIPPDRGPNPQGVETLFKRRYN